MYRYGGAGELLSDWNLFSDTVAPTTIRCRLLKFKVGSVRVSAIMLVLGNGGGAAVSSARSFGSFSTPSVASTASKLSWLPFPSLRELR